MSDLQAKIEQLKTQINGGLIVSCQAVAKSPLAKPEIIAAFAQTAELKGACGVRIDSPAHIEAVKKLVRVPIFGIHKIVSPDCEVYITPIFEAARSVAAAGADVIALDATMRKRPNFETLHEIVARIHQELEMPVMADVSTVEEGLYAAELNCDFISTTLSGYTAKTKDIIEPDFDLVKALASSIETPIICEGRLRSPADVGRAFDAGAFAVVVGNAITGIDNLVASFVAATAAAKVETN